MGDIELPITGRGKFLFLIRQMMFSPCLMGAFIPVHRNVISWLSDLAPLPCHCSSGLNEHKTITGTVLPENLHKDSAEGDDSTPCFEVSCLPPVHELIIVNNEFRKGSAICKR